jgi:Pyruvate/2-oxoacid:ferredoxin oxidoreductase delta subunit
MVISSSVDFDLDYYCVATAATCAKFVTNPITGRSQCTTCNSGYLFVPDQNICVLTTDCGTGNLANYQ